MKNWKTTLCGALAVLFTALSSVESLAGYKEILISLAGISTAVGLYFAKDSNITGGTVQQ